ncbi:DNA kinase/phosphatase Pnk1 [Saxophila tyrrhenica]|uniref:DNA kinase/phosphatase Pnk1 n=1 Tax=Saxophila tyrrhenica TaxID=1690608 RepID=A0AAV9PCS4_9PEZI|nr:DNA kinase/phosphatase Pnk1 [Saxophila tyrrhenica]
MEPGSRKRPISVDGDVSPPPSKRKLATTTTNKAVSNFFKPASEKEPEKVRIEIRHETLLTAQYDSAQSKSRPKPVKIAAFDFDDTLIATKSGLKFARTEDDWKWWHASVPARLKQLDAEGYTIVIISNQAAVSLRADPKTPNGMRSFNNIKGKVSAVFKALDLGISFYAATAHDIYRKPRSDMWEQLLKDYGLSDAGDVDHEGSLFVGDAAGRAGDKAAGVKKDHSCSDRDFAANVGIRFQTPEEFFLGEDTKPFTRIFDPAAHLSSGLAAQTETTPVLFTKKNKLDLVLFCGSPGAGKSTFYWQHMEPLGYERVNQDTLKTRDKCKKAATQFLQDGKGVVVDNTNADVETRQDWIALAKKLKVPVRLVHFTASAKLCEHNDTVRALTGTLVSLRLSLLQQLNDSVGDVDVFILTSPQMNPEKRTMLPKMAFTGFASRYREPTAGEGFQDVTKVDFEFRGTEEQRKEWSKYWIS